MISSIPLHHTFRLLHIITITTIYHRSAGLINNLVITVTLSQIAANHFSVT